MFNDWLVENKGKFISFGDMFLEAITNSAIIGEMAERDIEKLARIFRLIFLGSINECADGTATPVFREIMDYLNERKAADDR